MYNTDLVKNKYIHGTETLEQLSEAYNIPFRTLANHSIKGKWVEKRQMSRNRVNNQITKETERIKAKSGIKFDQHLIKSYETILRKTLTRIKHALKTPDSALKVKSLEGFMNSLANLSQTYRELTGKKLESKPTVINVIKHYDKPDTEVRRSFETSPSEPDKELEITDTFSPEKS